MPSFSLEEKGSPGELLDKYVEAYSGKDIEKYRSLFHPSAKITSVSLNGNVNLFSFPDFLEAQNRTFRRNRTVREQFGNIRIKVDGSAASVSADYTLTLDARRYRGTDYFQMVFEDGEWKIVSLLFTVNESIPLESEEDPAVRVEGEIRSRVYRDSGLGARGSVK